MTVWLRANVYNRANASSSTSKVHLGLFPFTFTSLLIAQSGTTQMTYLHYIAQKTVFHKAFFFLYHNRRPLNKLIQLGICLRHSTVFLFDSAIPIINVTVFTPFPYVFCFSKFLTMLYCQTQSKFYVDDGGRLVFVGQLAIEKKMLKHVRYKCGMCFLL